MAETNADLLLDETNNNETVLTINEDERIIEINGDLLLGVENDYKANKIFFLSPKIVGNDINLSLSTVEIFVSFKNASNELYISTCTKETYSDENFVLFSWLLTKEVTKTNGKVSFIVCAKNVVDSTLCNEWHTSIATGIVLKGITENDKTLIIDTDPASSVHQLKELVQNALDHVGDVNGYSKTEVDNKFSLFEDSLETDMIKYTNSPTQETEYLTAALNDIYSKVNNNSERLNTTNTNLTAKIDETNTNLTAKIDETNTNLESKLDEPVLGGAIGFLLKSTGPTTKPEWIAPIDISAGSILASYTTDFLEHGGETFGDSEPIYLKNILQRYFDEECNGHYDFGEIRILIIGHNTNFDDGQLQVIGAVGFEFGGSYSTINGSSNFLYAEIRIKKYYDDIDSSIRQYMNTGYDGSYGNVFTYEIIANGSVDKNFGIFNTFDNVSLRYVGGFKSENGYYYNLIKVFR